MEASKENQNVWDNILQSVEKRLNRQIFDAWFLPIQFEEFNEEEKVVKLKASQINRDWINTNYSDLISQTLNELNLDNYRLKWEVEESDMEEEDYPDDMLGLFSNEQDSSPQIKTPKNVDLFESRNPTPTTQQKSPTHFVDIEPIENSLNSKYTFDKFVVGSCNQFAHAAAEAVADARGKLTTRCLYTAESDLEKLI